MTLVKKLKAFLVVSRWEYLPCSINEVGLPAILALSKVTYSSHFLILTMWGLVIWWMGHFIGSQVNCITDYEADRLYKNYMADGVDILGRKPLIKIIIGETIFTTLLVLYLSRTFNRPYLLPFWLVGLVFGLIYSIEPFRLKGRVLLNSLALEVSLWICPMFLVYYLICGEFHLFPSLILLFFSLLMGVPMFFVDEVSDLEEDRVTGVNTPCVVYGRFKVTVMAIIIYVLTALAIMYSFIVFYPPLKKPLLFAVYLISFACFAKVAIDFFRLALSSYQYERSNPEHKKALAHKIKQQVRTPLWLVLSGIPVLCSAILILT